MRRAAAAVVLAVLVVVACLATLGSSFGDGGGPGTSESVASPLGDVRPRARRAVPPEEAEEADEDDGETADEEAPDDPDPPEPPRRVLRIVDGDGDRVLGVDVWQAVEDGEAAEPRPQRTTGADGEASFVADGEANRVAFFDGDVTRTLELRDAVTEAVVRNLPTLLVSAVDARSGIALDPVRLRFARGWRDGREAWTGGKRPVLAVSSDGSASCSVEIDAPAGYGGYRTNAWSGELALRAKTARLVVPLFEATWRTLRVTDRDGTPLRGATLLEGIVTSRAEPSSADGILRVEGLPRIPFTRVGLSVRWEAEGRGSLQGGAALFDLCAEPPEEPIVVVLGHGGSYRGPSGEVPG